MIEKWEDGASFVQGDGYPLNPDTTYSLTNFAFFNNPYLNEGIHEGGFIRGDFRAYASFDTQALAQNSQILLDFALFMNRQGDYIENMHGLYSVGKKTPFFSV